MTEAGGEVSLPVLQDLFEGALADPRIKLLRDLSPPHLSVTDKWRVFFSARCACGVSALFSVDISKEKRRAEIEEKLPQLVKGLSTQTDQFLAMPCDLHQKMRLR